MKLVKIFSEIRFEQSFLFDEGKVKNGILKKLKSEFPVYGNDKENNSLIFINQKSNTKVSISNNRLVIDIDDEPDINRIKTVTNSIAPFIMNVLEIEYTQRIGIRANFIKEDVKGGDNVSNFITGLFYSNPITDFINSEHASNSNNVTPHLGFSIKLNHEMNMNVNIAMHQVGTGTIDPTTGQFSAINVEGEYPLIDLDIFTIVQKSPDQINGVLKAFCDKLSLYSHKMMG